MLDRQIANQGQRTLFGHDFLCECDCALQQVTFDYLVEQLGLRELFRHHRRAADDHVERSLEADDARQPLRAAGARKDAQLDLGQRDLRARRRDAEVATERELEAATHRHGVYRGDHRFGRCFDRAYHRVQMRLGRRLRRVEFLDVRAAGECLAGADQNNRLDLRIRMRRVDAVDDCGAQCETETVDRRIVQRDHGNVAVPLIGR